MILAGTGHRPSKLGGYEAHASARVLTFAGEVLKHCKPSLVISGMAQGWDMSLAQAAVTLKIPFDAYIPFVGQELVWPAATRLYYLALLEKARKVVICSPGGFTKAAMQVRNQRMVDDCDLLAALWNGSNGGTANCIAYASFSGRPYINFWPSFIMKGDPRDQTIPIQEAQPGQDSVNPHDTGSRSASPGLFEC